MSPRVRRLVWIGGSLVALLVAAAIAVPLFVDINRYRGTMESEAEKLLRRDVSLGKMKLTLLPFPGIGIEPLAIASDQKGDPPLLKADSLSAHVRILPLLRGKIVVASLVAHRPQLYLHRYPDGRSNLPDFSAAAPGAAPAPAGAPSQAGGGLTLAKLRIEEASLRLVDEAVLPGKTVTTSLSGVNLALDDFAPGRPFRVNLETDLPPRSSGSLELEGTVALPPATPGPAPAETSVQMKLDKFQAVAFTPYFVSLAGFEPPLGAASGTVRARGRLKSGAQGAWELEGDGRLLGDLELRGIALRPAARGGKPARAGDLDLKLDIAMTPGGKRLDLRTLEATTGKTRLSAAGSLELGEQSGRIDVEVRPSQVMAEDLATVAALLGAKFPAGLTSAAPIAFQGGASGPLEHPDQIEFRGEISLTGVRYADPSLGKPVEDVAGKLTFEKGAFKVSQFAARVGETRVQGSLSLRDFSAPQITLDLHSPKAKLDDLMALMTPSKSAPSPSQAPAGGGDILAKTRGAGSIKIDEGSFGTFRFSRFQGTLNLANKVVTFDPVSFQLYGGGYRGALSADLRSTPPRYAYRSSLAGVDAQPFLSENLGVSDLLAGRVSADLEMAGGGSDLGSILNSLQGSGTLKVEQGWIGQLNVMSGLAKASDLLGERTLSQVSSNLAKQRTDFSSLTGDLKIAAGRATSSNLKLVSKDLSLEGKGGFTLAGVLDLNLKVLFSKELTEAMLQEGSRARYLEREGDRIVLPLTIKGPLASPTYMVDVKGIARAAVRTEALERITGGNSSLSQIAGALLGGKSGSKSKPPAGAGAESPATEAGGDTPKTTASASTKTLAASADGAILVSGSKYEGGLLMPDLTLRGTFSGVGLSGADIKVVGKGDRTVWEKSDAFKEIAAYYAAHDPQAPAKIPFKMKIDGKRLAGAGDLTITITLRRSDGTASVETFSEKKPGL